MNLPNKITLTRILMIPVFIAVFFLDGILPYNYAIAAAIFALAATAMMLLLMLPGLFLRKGMDDALYIAYAVCVCVIMARELIISAFPQTAATNGLLLAAAKLGKYKTACQDVSIVVLLVAADLTGKAFDFVCGAGLALFAFATILTVWSGISYVVKNKQVLKDA